MARRVNKHLRPARPLGLSHASTTTKADGTWVVRSIAGERATKVYTCPGCHRPIPVGAAHIVAWPHLPALGLERASDARRHWHSGCWSQKR